MRWITARSLVLDLLVLAAAAAIAAYGALVLVTDRKADFLASRLQYLEIVADHKAQSIRAFHRERLSDFTFYARDPHLRQEYQEHLAGKPSPGNDVLRTFSALLNRGIYTSVTLVDRRGRVVFRVPADAVAVKPSPEPAGRPRLLGLRKIDDGRSVLDYEVGTVDGARLLFRVSNISWLSPLIEHWPGAAESAEVVIFQREEDHLIPATALRHASPLFPDRRVPIAADTIAGRAARGEAGSLHGRDYRGVTVYATTRTFPELGWILVAKADEAELLAPLREKFYLHLLAALGVAALIAAAFILFMRSHTDRLRAEADAERRLLAAAIEQAGESVVITDKNARIIYTNPAFTRATGYTREEALGRNPSMLKSGRHDLAFYKEMWATLLRGETWKGRFVNRNKSGAPYEEEATITPIHDASGATTHYIAVKRDVSVEKSLEEQLFHSQKMEAIGRLAGGVAHDFNNILTTINGYTEMLSDAAPPDSQSATDLAEILGAGRRAAMLTRQLLTFSRRAPADPVVGDLCVPVRALEKMLRRTLGEDLRLELSLPGEPLWVRTDSGQIDQVLMNLAVNARDAMSKGGKLSVSVHASEFAADKAQGLEVIPAGRYAALVVKDNGCGMEEATLARIFEPFFTTKEKGKGTGLGLSTVFGIVKQNKGFISVASVVGAGTTFTVHLPLVAAPAEAPAADAPIPPSPVRGDETILVVEDQSEVLRMVTRVLTAQGYQVIACGGADRALEAAKAADGPIHLLLTDVVMPVLGGEELAQALRALRPETRVLFMSGYTDGRLDRLRETGETVDLILKPFTAEQLCRRVRDALDANRGPR